jgi:enamine deaminase RidA (YjgF/YER057c/UK114 family)
MRTQSLNPAGLAPPFGPFAHVTVSQPGRLVHIAGAVALNAQAEIVGVGDVAAQTEQVMKNLAIALAAAGADFSHVVKITNYVTNAADYPKIAEVRGRYLVEPFPASTLIEVQSLIYPELLIEIEAVAVIPDP